MEYFRVVASGCVVECRICNREVAGSNLGRGYFSPRSTQPSIPPVSVNEYQLRLGRQRQVWLIPLVDETQGVQVKLCYHLTMCAMPERLRDASCGGDIQTDITFTCSLTSVARTGKLLLFVVPGDIPVCADRQGRTSCWNREPGRDVEHWSDSVPRGHWAAAVPAVWRS